MRTRILIIASLIVGFLFVPAMLEARFFSSSQEQPSSFGIERYQVISSLNLENCPAAEQKNKRKKYEFSFEKDALVENNMGPIETLAYALSVIIVNADNEENDFCIERVYLFNETKADDEKVYLTIIGYTFRSPKEIQIIKRDFNDIAEKILSTAQAGYNTIREQTRQVGEFKIILKKIEISRQGKKIKIIFHKRNILHIILKERF